MADKYEQNIVNLGGHNQIAGRDIVNNGVDIAPPLAAIQSQLDELIRELKSGTYGAMPPADVAVQLGHASQAIAQRDVPATQSRLQRALASAVPIGSLAQSVASVLTSVQGLA